jgi:hypothetical protein
MKKLTIPFIFYSCFFMPSCGTPKVQLMQTEQLKIENTLLETKEKLALSIRTLNKLLDSRATEQQNYQDSLADLSHQLNSTFMTLDSVRMLQKTSREKGELLEQQLSESANAYKKKIAPFVKFQSKIRQQQRNLSAMYQDLKMLLENSPGIKYELVLNKNDVTVVLENFFLYQPKKYFLTENGRWVVFLIGEVLNKKSSISTEIILFPATEDKESWDLLSSRGMSIHDRLREKGIGDARIKTTNIVGTKREQTVLVLSYPVSNLLKLLPSR